jgi:hypothetical protein
VKECRDCKSREEGYYGIFDVSCPVCRTSIALSQPCKIARKFLVERMLNKWGPTEGWEVEPHCGCIKVCKQNQRIQKDV